MKRLFKWIGIVLLSPVLLFLILAALLYVPPIQNWVAQRVVAYASEQTGMEIAVDHVDLDFPLDLGIDGVRVINAPDTIADIGRVVADVQFWPLLDGRVVLNALELHQARLNTVNFIDDMRLEGTIGSLTLSSPGIDPALMEMELHHPSLKDADLAVYMSDTAAIDTSTTGWHILMDRLKMERTRITVLQDSAALFTDAVTHFSAYMEQAAISDADIDLGLGRFAFGPIEWEDGSLNYNDQMTLSNISLGLDSLYSYQSDLRLGISHGSLHIPSFGERLPADEHSPDAGAGTGPGLELTSLTGQVTMDSETISVKHFSATTPHSSLSAEANVDIDGISDVDISASLGKSDLMLLSPSMAHLPDYPLLLQGQATGTTDRMDVKKLSVTLPTVFHAETSGQLGNLTDPDHLQAQLNVKAEAFNPSTLHRALELPASVALPKGLQLSGTVNADGQRYHADLTARDGSATARLKGTYTPGTDSYSADLTARQLNLRRFLPTDSLGMLSADVQLSGRGTDPFAPASQLDADILLHHLDYGSISLDSLQGTAAMRGGILKANADLGFANTDMLTLGLGSKDQRLGLSGSVELESDLRQRHKLSALLSGISISDSLGTRHPENVGLLLKLDRDTTTVRLQSGDFILKLDGSTGYEHLLAKAGTLADSIASQLKHRTIDQPLLKAMLPTAKVYITSQRNNPLADILRVTTGIDFKDMNIDLSMSPQAGLNGTARLDCLTMGDIQLDTLRLNLIDKGQGLTFNGQVTNNRKNPMAVFNVLFDGLLQEHGASFGFRYFDEQGQRNIRLGAKAEMVQLGSEEENGIRFQLIPKRPTLGYKEFELNDDNFLLLHNNMKLEANIDLKADDGTHLKVYTENQDPAMLQDITVSAHQLNLDELTSGVPFLPKIAGMLEGDYHLLMDADHNISVASDMHIGQMAYEGSPIGNLGTEFVYLLREDGTHVVDGTLMLDDEPIGTLQGSLYSGEPEAKSKEAISQLDATLTLTSLPLSIANGFMPDQLFGFEGTASGTLSVKGQLAKLNINGDVTFADGYLVSVPYGMRMRFGDKPLNIKDSRLLFENFALYAYNDNPLTISGNANLMGSEGGSDIDLRLSARDFQLINARQTKESVAYGRMFVNFFARLGGTLEQMTMRGRLDVLGTTDLNYILLDSPLSTDNQMDELVRFTNFNDTTQVAVVQRPESDEMNMDMQISIDQGAHVRCALNADQSNYVDLLGGGDLRMRMDANGLNLMGRYTVVNGTMKYSLPIIPLKTFSIKEDSYVEFTGAAANPTLNLTATERRKASVSSNDGMNRSVTFDCGVVITQTLENMGLQFIISAPEDMQVQNELATMSTEQRGKLAVTMLTTGMYLADGNTSAFSMNSALNSFLQSEINNITANTLKTVDLQVGLDNSIDASGQTHTDYSFRFAKRFWNNRLNVQIGGKVSSGAEVQGQQQSFFDNVTMEYRLSPTSNQYLKLFYKQNVYDWLEGYTGEYGGGFLWKRKLDKLTDIFRKSTPVTPQRLAQQPTPDPSQREGRLDRPANDTLPQDSTEINE